MPVPTSIYLSIGSNVEPGKNIPQCLALLKKKFPGICFSSVYETAPVAPSGNRLFWNLAASISYSGHLDVLRKKLRVIENDLGRTRDPGNKFAPRSIDIDILPQDGYTKQPFIMIPLAEIAPDERAEPGQKTFRELAESFEEEIRSYRIVIPRSK